jgi:Ca2+-binding EF-hand superfamily protein
MNLSFASSRWVAAGALIAGVFASTTFAAPAAPPPPSTPAPDTSTQPCGPGGGMDVNRIKERGAKEFARIDTNGDGKITEAEFLAAEPQWRGGGPGHRMGPGKGGWGMGGPGMGGPGMGGPGIGGPGTGMGPGMGPHFGMTDAQLQTFNADLFKALDTDGNGQLSPTEFAKAHDTMHTMMKKQAFVRFDTNKDGVLTKDEFPPFAKEVAAMDTNGDGKVTREEMQAAKAKQAPPTPAPAPTPN